LEFVWHIEGHCQSSVIAALYAAKINNAITVPLLQQTAMLLTGWCHITLSPHEKSAPPCDAALRQNYFTACCSYSSLLCSYKV